MMQPDLIPIQREREMNRLSVRMFNRDGINSPKKADLCTLFFFRNLPQVISSQTRSQMKFSLSEMRDRFGKNLAY